MNKRITLTTEVGTKMSVHVDELQRLASGERTQPDSAWVCLRLVTCRSDAEGWTLTPRGEDLIASAHLIPDDPEPAQPVDEPCDGCNGTGEQALFMSTHVCDVCKGSRVKPRAITRFCGAQDSVPEAPRRGQAAGVEGWVRIDSADAALPFIGERVEICAETRGALQDHDLHGRVRKLISVNDGELLFAHDPARPGFSACIGWHIRGNIRLRLAGVDHE